MNLGIVVLIADQILMGKKLMKNHGIVHIILKRGVGKKILVNLLQIYVKDRQIVSGESIYERLYGISCINNFSDSW